MKTCSRCSTTKELTSFGRRKDSRDGKNHWCLDCVREYHRNYRNQNPDKIKEIQKRHRRKNRNEYLAYQRYAVESVKKYRASL